MREKIMMCFLIFIGIFFFTLDVNSKDSDNTELKALTSITPLIINTDTIPQKVNPTVKYIDPEEKLLDIPAFEKMIEKGNIKIVVKDGEIEEMEINGEDLTEEEINKIHYNLSENQRKKLIQGVDVLILVDEEEGEQTEEERTEIQDSQQKEKIKNKTLNHSYSSELRQDKERIKADLRKQKLEIRAIVEEAKQNAKTEIRRFKSQRIFSAKDFEFDQDLTERITDISEDLREEMKDFKENFKLESVEIIEDLAEEMKELSEELEEEFRDIQKDNIEMNKELEMDLEELNQELEEQHRIIEIDMKNVEFSSNDISQVISNQLLKDDLIQGLDKFSFVIKKNNLYVDGKIQSTQMREKYTALLTNLTDMKWSPKSRIKIMKKRNTQTSEISIKNY